MIRARRIALSIVACVVILAGGAGLLGPRLLFGPSADYSAVISIEQAPVYKDPVQLQRAFLLPVAARYRDQLEFQKNPSFCGPTSAVNVLRSLGASADQNSILDGTGTTTLFGILPAGMTLDRLARLLEQKQSGHVTVLRDFDLAAFRAEVAHANDPARRYIVNFHRGPLFGQGGGHHSPLAGYLADEDLVLVLDVNAKYRPWLVKTERLFAAVDTVDFTSGKKRGLIRIEIPQ
jgi:hypothetical protein